MERRSLAALLFLALLAAPVLAQVTGSISGSVVDASGSAVPGANVQVLLAGGTTPVLSSKTTSEGYFSFIGVRPGSYDIKVEAAGFAAAVINGVTVDPIRETAVPQIRLAVAASGTTIEVTAATQTVQTANAEIANTINAAQIDRLPVLDRDVLSLAQTQAGVLNATPIGLMNGNDTVINGLRSTYTNVTLDGINIQDNFLRENGVGFSPNELKSCQVEEMTVATSNTSAALGGGASQINLVSPSGTNTLHGEALWYNRNNALAANDWFSNQNGTPKPFLNRNTAGGHVGGPIIKNKLFFFAAYEGAFDHEQAVQEGWVLTPDARNGIYSYYDNNNVLQKVNLLAAKNAKIDPFVASDILPLLPSTINDYNIGDSSPGHLMNTGGYQFNQRDDERRQVVSGRVDFNASTTNSFFGAVHLAKDRADRPDLANGFTPVPQADDDAFTKLISGTWRWSPSANFTNELRGGVNLSPVHLNSLSPRPAFFESQDWVIWNSPVNEFLNQGRNTNTGTIGDTANYVHGRHNFQFGFNFQILHIYEYNDGGTVPSYDVAMGSGQNALGPADLPGVGSDDLFNANWVLASLGGFVDGYTQTFNVTNRTSGFVPGATDGRNWRYNNYAGFGQDQWRVSSRFTLNLGLRWEYYAPVNETNGLVLMPVVQNNNPVETLLSNASLNFAGSGAGRPIYRSDLNNFAPHVGLAWDVFGDGKTALRAGYSINYVDDNNIATVLNAAGTNSGLQTVVGASGLSGTLSNNRPAIPTPVFQVPLTAADNYALNPGNAMALIDPNLRTPYVQQWNVGVEHDFKGTLLAVRYVGNHGVKELRALDVNQININSDGFLQDFLRARSNGNLALTATGAFDPRYNASIPGSQQLTVFPLLAAGGHLTNGTIENDIQQGQPGTLASLYQQNHLNGSVNFYANPYIQGGNLTTNFSNSTYNALQVEVRHRTRSGLQLQANYVWSKVLSDSLGDQQARFEPLLDNNNPKIERARAPYDLTHVFHANGTYQLPLGAGHHLLSSNRVLSRIVGGWTVGSIATWQSGAPFSILSERGTLNRDGIRAYQNTASSSLTGSQLSNVVGFYMTGNGPSFINPANINRDGRGTTQEGNPTFAGQAFTNPGPGTVGSLQRRMFNNPSVFLLDANLVKVTRITERQSLEIRLEALNALNHTNFFDGANYENLSTNTPDPQFNINNSSFGRISDTFNSSREIQIGLRYSF